MVLMLLFLLLHCVTAVAKAQVPLHSLALINDARSHGQVGDRYLSLNESIQLSNQTLPLSLLSADELRQINGFGDIAFAEIDARVVPLVTLERDLDPILDTYHGYLLGSSFGTATIDIGNTRGIRADSDFVDFRNLRIRGGRVGIVVNQTNTLYGSLFEGLTFEGQTEVGLRILLASDTGNTRINLRQSRFVNLQKAVEIWDIGSNRGSLGSADVFLSDLTFTGGRVGLDIRLGRGGRTFYTLERCTFDGVEQAMLFSRESTASDRNVLLDCTHLVVRGARQGLMFEGLPGPSTVLLRMLDFSPAQGGTALSVFPLGAGTATTLEDSRLTGIVELLGGNVAPVCIGNRMDGAAMVIGATAGTPLVEETILKNSSTNAAGTAPVLIRTAAVEGGTLDGSAAPITLTDSFGSAQILGAVTVVRPLPQSPIGSIDCVPTSPPIGTSMTWSVDLPPGLAAFFVLGLTDDFPFLLPRPFRFYWLPSTEVFLPIGFRGQTTIPVPVPNDLSLVGLDLMLQAAVVPDPFIAAPAISLPPGRRIRIVR